MDLGCRYLSEKKCTFTLWAPLLDHVDLKINQPHAQRLAMRKMEKGYWQAELEGLQTNTRYSYILPGEIERPDPTSHYQPDGVHGPSQVINHEQFIWKDQSWQGIPLADMIIYELHIGTFTEKGTFEAAIDRLNDLMELGVNTIEIMPVAAFPGNRNWGYDGVGLYAVQASYGGPYGLKKLIDACHQRGLAVILDVVYNHLGPEGNYLREFGPYFTNKYQTPWGEALNFDDVQSDEVRQFFIENALHWLKHYHIDGLRLDAVHAITDMSAKPFLAELAESVQQFNQQAGRVHYLIAESDLNDSRMIKSPRQNGIGLHATWHDDFHHCVHTILTGEDQGYYQDFGQVDHLVKALENGFVYDGNYSNYRGRKHGNASVNCPVKQFVVCIQNHDQIGNRLFGERLAKLVDYPRLKLGAATLLLSPYVPMLFMGEEYGEDAPFQYFIDHTDQALVEAVRRGRREEFKAFQWEGEVPDPAGELTFKQSILQWDKTQQDQGKQLRAFYQRLIFLRKTLPALQLPDRDRLKVTGDHSTGLIIQQRWYGNAEAIILLNFSQQAITYRPPTIKGSWEKIIDSEEPKWGGQLQVAPPRLPENTDLTIQPCSALLYHCILDSSKGSQS